MKKFPWTVVLIGGAIAFYLMRRRAAAVTTSAPAPRPVNWSAILPGPGMLRTPPSGFKMPYGEILPMGTYFTGKINQMPAPPMALDRTPWFIAEVILPNGQRGTRRVVQA